jgi:hypothetical protein
MMFCEGCDDQSWQDPNAVKYSLPTQYCPPLKKRRPLELNDNAIGFWVRLRDGVPCSATPYCQGGVPPQDLQGWVYVPPHCKVRVFSRDEAWACLDDEWIVFVGDSTIFDHAANLLTHVLGIPWLPDAERTDWHWKHNQYPEDPDSAALRTTSFWIGGPSVHPFWIGLGSFREDFHRPKETPPWRTIRDQFPELIPGPLYPTLVVATSGAHDALYIRNGNRTKFPMNGKNEEEQWRRNFVTMAEFFDDALRALEEKHGALGAHGVEYTRPNVTERSPQTKFPPFIWRTAPAAAAQGRIRAFNNARLRMQDHRAVDILKTRTRYRERWGGVIDYWDLSYPFHFDNQYADYIHYGRRLVKFFDGRPTIMSPNSRLVDEMLAQV